MDKYKVNKDECIGCGFCVSQCPEVFCFDENEKAESYAEATKNTENDAESALNGCPVNAIYKE